VAHDEMALFNVTDPTPYEQDEVALLQAIFLFLSKYTWIVPSTLGIPGNILSVVVANKKHNRRLSPCVYMTAMAVADTVFLLEITWFYSLFYTGYLDGIVMELAYK
jgi:hypothetical protein